MVQKYAMIDGEDVFNIAVFETREDAIYVSRAVKGEDATAINIEQIDVHFGAKYRDGVFYNVDEEGNETQAEDIPTYDQSIQTLNNGQAELESNQSEIVLTLADLIGGETNAE